MKKLLITLILVLWTVPGLCAKWSATSENFWTPLTMDHSQGVAYCPVTGYAILTNDDKAYKMPISGNRISGTTATETLGSADIFKDLTGSGMDDLSACDTMTSVDCYNGYAYTRVKTAAGHLNQHLVVINMDTFAIIDTGAIGNDGNELVGCCVANPTGDYRIYMIDKGDDALKCFQLTGAADAGNDIVIDTTNATGGAISGEQDITWDGTYFYINCNNIIYRMTDDGTIIHKMRIHSLAVDDGILEGMDIVGDELWIITHDEPADNGSYVYYLDNLVSYANRDIWYVDNSGGSDTVKTIDRKGGSPGNDGSAAYPLATIEAICNDEGGYLGYNYPGRNPDIRLIDNGPTSPYREQILPEHAGIDADNKDVFQAASTIAYIAGSEDFTSPGTTWAGPDGNGEYTVACATEVKTLATCSLTNWTNSGITNLSNATEGAAGGLNAGEWDWAANVLYYKPTGNLEDVHIEASQRAYCVYNLDQNYIEYRNLYCVLGNVNVSTTRVVGVDYYYCTFANAKGKNAVRLETNGDTVLLQGCLMRDCNYGLYVDTTDDPTSVMAKFCIIRDNVRGSYLRENNISLLNCTVFNNTNEGIWYVLLNATGSVVKNTIAWDNGTDVDEENAQDTPDFDYNDYHTNGNWSAGAHDIDSDPLFVDPSNGDFTLQSNSPCIDSGLDLGDGTQYLDFEELNQDQYGFGWEMGAYIYADKRIISNKAVRIIQNIPHNIVRQ